MAIQFANISNQSSVVSTVMGCRVIKACYDRIFHSTLRKFAVIEYYFWLSYGVCIQEQEEIGKERKGS
jgi:hypothetical protein